MVSSVKPGDYLGVQAFLSSEGEYEQSLRSLREALLASTGACVQSGYGPRYLHSTGQLHKGGPDSGVFILLCREGGPDLKIAGQKYSFGQLCAAQCLGDFAALEAAGRRAVLVRITGDPQWALKRLVRAVENARAAGV